MRSRSHKGLYRMTKNSFMPRTAMAASAQSGGILLLAALFASCMGSLKYLIHSSLDL